MDEAALLDPDLGEALAAAGCLLHWVASDSARVAQFAADMEHCPGDLPPALMDRYLAAVHRVLEPGCPYPAATRLREMR